MHSMTRLPRPLLLGLALVAACVVAAAAVGLYCLSSTDGGAEAGQSEAGPSAAPTPSTEEPSPEPGRGEATWRKATTVYAQAFVDTSGGREAWLGRLERLVSPSLAQGYTYTDLDRLPVATFDSYTGGQSVAGETPSRMVRLHYACTTGERGALAVDVVVSQIPATGRWVVTTAIPAQGPGPGGPQGGTQDGTQPGTGEPVST